MIGVGGHFHGGVLGFAVHLTSCCSLSRAFGQSRADGNLSGLPDTELQLSSLRIGQHFVVATVLDEAERAGRRRRLLIIVVVAVLILAGFLLFGRLRSSALDDKTDAAVADLRPAWRQVNLAGLRDAYDQATVDANASGDYSKAIKLFPESGDASFVSADLSTPGAIAARYSVETWAGHQCLDVVARSPEPNRVTFTTHKGC